MWLIAQGGGARRHLVAPGGHALSVRTTVDRPPLRSVQGQSLHFDPVPLTSGLAGKRKMDSRDALRIVRAALEKVNIEFDEGDAEHLPYQAGAFDLVVSMFGAMFAPRPECHRKRAGSGLPVRRAHRDGQLDAVRLYRRAVQGYRRTFRRPPACPVLCYGRRGQCWRALQPSCDRYQDQANDGSADIPVLDFRNGRVLPALLWTDCQSVRRSPEVAQAALRRDLEDFYAQPQSHRWHHQHRSRISRSSRHAKLDGSRGSPTH
jgi:hypothetical protein